MEDHVKQQTRKKCRKNERGAALVTVLMISVLLFVAAAALLLESSMNTANVTDATAEEQAYYAAESGIQTVVNVLRRNTEAEFLVDPSKPATDPVNRIDYLKASKLASSNRPGDGSTEARLSRWIKYDPSDNDRVVLGTTTGSPNYTKRDGFAFKIAIENPDNPDGTVSYNTTGKIGYLSTSTGTWSSGGLTIQYLPVTVNNLDVSSGAAVTNFGKFLITGSGTVSTRVRFVIKVNMTKPYAVTKVIRGFIEKGNIPSVTSAETVKIFYDSQNFILLGSTFTLTGGNIVEETLPTIRVGYEVVPNAPTATNLPEESLGETLIRGTMTEPEPTRLLIRSTGFGPRGAVKELETVIYKNYFDGLGAPSPLLLIGKSNCTFNPGDSSQIGYSGKDVFLRAFLPPIGVTNDPNLLIVKAATASPPEGGSFKGDVIGTVSNVADELPPWLQSPTNLDDTLKKLKEVAVASGRYFPSGVTPETGGYGDSVTGKGITFIDGNLEFSGAGGGILVVTGNLKFEGGFVFNGLVIVTGSGGLTRSGGGNGNLQGNIIIAPYNPTNLIGPDPTDPLSGFLIPKYNISGGGNSDVVYNSNNVDSGLSALSNFVKGVAEK